MRLIDADKLKKVIHCAYSDDLEILEKIDLQPTAYDIDKVVEELEKEIKLYENSMSIMGGNDADIEYYGAMKGLGKAIEIVKECGKNEEN